MLFSEPKIPQSVQRALAPTRGEGFSALQRAENSSNQDVVLINGPVPSFSALQRAENSSNDLRGVDRRGRVRRFSALQRAENSSNAALRVRFPSASLLFQCSSASRKFLKLRMGLSTFRRSSVSVLFSEPKIPQIDVCLVSLLAVAGFSALQRAENSSNVKEFVVLMNNPRFQCSSASRKFLKS